MPREAAGELRHTEEGWVARITMDRKHRESYLLSGCSPDPRDDQEARERCKLLATLARRFRKAGKLDDPNARRLLELAASSASALIPGVLTVAGELIGGQIVLDEAAPMPTFG